MIDWCQVRHWVNGLVLLAMLLMPVMMIFASAMRKMSRRGACGFIFSVIVAAVAADKVNVPENLRGALSPSIFLPCGSTSLLDDDPPVYTNPVRFASFSYSDGTMEAAIAWDWDWAPGARYHFVNLYGSYALQSGRRIEVDRIEIERWGQVTNHSFSICWPTVFSNAVISGSFPTNATLDAGFLWGLPELDTDGDGIDDAEEMCVYRTRWDLRDSDGDGISDYDELFHYETDPMNLDTDGDCMPDGWELRSRLDPCDPSDAFDDLDMDGLSNFEEALFGTRADLRDTDGDLISDYDEIYLYGTDPCLADTDGDGMDDRAEIVAGFDPCFAGEYHGPERPIGFNPGAYCTVGITAAAPMTWIRFEGDGESDLADPSFFIRTNETVNVTLLMGKTYRVLATNEIGVVSIGDPGITVVTNAPGDLTIVRPVTVLVAPRYNLMLLGAGPAESDGSFRMQVSPAVGGTFEWTNTCCTITSRGDSFWFACGGECSCSGCYASGWLVYEGYALPCLGGFCGCPHEDDEPRTEEDDQAHAAGVELSFSKRAVIFEDAYTNAPGEVVARRSTVTALSCTAHGGPRGARLSLSLAGAEKLVAISGPDFPSSARFIPPGQKLDFAIEYEGLLPSDAVNDIVASATLIEEETDARHFASNTVTSVCLQLVAIYEAPENPNPSRHVYGVGEKVRFKVTPISQNVSITTEKLDVRDRYYDYELFDGDSTTVYGNVEHIYVCPISANYHPPIKVRCFGVMYEPLIAIVEPNEVITKGASWGENAVDIFYSGNRKCWPSGDVGSACLVTTNYIGPMTVSFLGISVSEVPCQIEDIVTGCYTNGHYRTHTGPTEEDTGAGAGKGYYIKPGNFWFVDSAVQGRAERNWSPDSCLSWNIPIGWHRIHFSGEGWHLALVADKENYGVNNSRELIIGGRFDAYKQVWHIDLNGTCRTDKFGHWISRSRNCRVILDGQVLQTSHNE